MTRRQQILLVMSIAGFCFANTMVILFMVKQGGLDFGAYFKRWFETLPAAQLAGDIGIAFVAFSLWAAWEGRRLGMRSWWMPVPASLAVGLCFALPLFLFLRDRHLAGELPSSEGWRGADRLKSGPASVRQAADIAS
jgi:uncharacterized protein DUF2834